MTETLYTHWNCTTCPDGYACVEWTGNPEKDPTPVPKGWRHFVCKPKDGRFSLTRIAVCAKCVAKGIHPNKTGKFLEVMEAGDFIDGCELEKIPPKKEQGKVIPRHKNPFITKNRRMKINLDTGMWE